MATETSSFINKYIFKPITSGGLGFASFLFVLILTKLISVMVGTLSTFIIEFDDLLLSLIGFILLFLIRFLENFREKEAQKFV